MHKLRHLVLLLWLGLVGIAVAAPPVYLVNPLQGTDSTPAFSHGNCYPAVALPFPMNTWAPCTQPLEDPFFYQYRQNKIRGIRQTHQPNPWLGDYGAFSLMPVSGKLVVKEEERASIFRRQLETAQPSYYSVYLDTWKARAEVTPTERCARFRFTFDQPGENFVVIDAFTGGSSVEIIPSENKIVGVSRYNNGGVPGNFANYFVIIFDCPFTSYGVWWQDGVRPGETRMDNKRAGAYLRFDTKSNRIVGCKVASSFISPEQALRNLNREIGEADFDTVRQLAEMRWNQALGRALVEGGTEDQQRTFYTALYRTLLFPHKFYEIGKQGQPVYYSPYDGRLHDGYLYTDSEYANTFRAAHPLYNLLFPEVSAEILQGLVAAYEQSGWLPSSSSPGHRDRTFGNPAFSLLADGWVKGVRSFDTNKAFNAIVHDATVEGPIASVGRSGAKFYNALGFIPSPTVSNATAKTLDFAYNDYCAALVAKAAGRTSEATQFLVRSMNYRNLFDPKIGFMRGRKEDGSWCEPFNPTEWGGPFYEGNAWHWTWNACQDIPGLISLMGGDALFAAKLDQVFTSPNSVRVGTYGRPIHEMSEMTALDMGQYAHGNAVLQHLIYLYDYAGQPWKTQSRVRATMARLYQPTADGLCSDEDTGQLSAWYVFSALGFYPVCPGDTAYAIGSPIFDRATLTLQGGRVFIINARGNGTQHPYIRAAALNGRPFNRVYLRHREISNGGQLTFEMASAPDQKWAVVPNARPPSAAASAGAFIQAK